MFRSDPKVERILDITEKILSLATERMQEDVRWQNMIDKVLEKMDRSLQDIAHQVHQVDNDLDSRLLCKFEEANRRIDNLATAIENRGELEAEIIKLKKLLDRKNRRAEK